MTELKFRNEHERNLWGDLCTSIADPNESRGITFGNMFLADLYVAGLRVRMTNMSATVDAVVGKNEETHAIDFKTAEAGVTSQNTSNMVPELDTRTPLLSVRS